MMHAPEDICKRSRELASSRLDRRLRSDVLAVIDRHIAACPDCKRFHDDFEAIAREARLLADESVSQDFLVRTLALARSRAPGTLGALWRRRAPRLAAASVLAVAALAAAYEVGRRSGDSGDGMTRLTAEPHFVGRTPPADPMPAMRRFLSDVATIDSVDSDLRRPLLLARLRIGGLDRLTSDITPDITPAAAVFREFHDATEFIQRIASGAFGSVSFTVSGTDMESARRILGAMPSVASSMTSIGFIDGLQVHAIVDELAPDLGAARRAKLVKALSTQDL